MSYRVKRKVDTMGRVVLPIEIRRSLDIECGDDILITLESGHILMEPSEKSCIFCGSSHGLREIRNRCVCQECIKSILTKYNRWKSP